MLNIRLVEIGERETEEAIRVHVRYGKGTGHPARTNNARLLYKGDDFIHTDMA